MGAGAAEEEALHEFTAKFLQNAELRQGFNAFGGDFQLQASGQGKDGGDHCLGILVFAEGVDEALVDFQAGERKITKIAKAGIARAEIIQRHANANFPRCFQ